ncbi:MAG: class I SAM-dependent methyltransferase [Acidobacteriota bacterium]|nr:class I SAM-dependent methyltransferase [Acidobacteriota bacterium]
MRGVEQIPWLYDAMMAISEWRGLARWRAWVAGGAGDRVLEVGCGSGRNLPHYDAETRVVALEPDWTMLLVARRRAPGAVLVLGRAEELPFAEEHFDTVVSALVFCSVDDPDIALAEVGRVLRPGGELRMMEHVRSEHPVLGKLQDWSQPLWTRVAGGCRPNRCTEASVEAAGFVITSDGRRRSGVMRRFAARWGGSSEPEPATESETASTPGP